MANSITSFIRGHQGEGQHAALASSAQRSAYMLFGSGTQAGLAAAPPNATSTWAVDLLVRDKQMFSARCSYVDGELFGGMGRR